MCYLKYYKENPRTKIRKSSMKIIKMLFNPISNNIHKKSKNSVYPTNDLLMSRKIKFWRISIDFTKINASEAFLVRLIYDD